MEIDNHDTPGQRGVEGMSRRVVRDVTKRQADGGITDFAM